MPFEKKGVRKGKGSGDVRIIVSWVSVSKRAGFADKVILHLGKKRLQRGE